MIAFNGLIFSAGVGVYVLKNLIIKVFNENKAFFPMLE